MSKALIVFGDKTAEEILPIARRQYAEQFEVIEKVYFDERTSEDKEFQRIKTQFDQVCFVIGVVEIRLRKKIQEFAVAAGLTPFTVVHESADIAESAKIGEGCFVAAQAVISENAAIGDYSIIHFHSSIGHDSSLGDHCTILPGARISGEVRLGEGVLVGSNAFVFQRVSVGDFCQIDALTYVRKDLPARTLLSSQIPGTNLPKPVKRLDLDLPESES